MEKGSSGSGMSLVAVVFIVLFILKLTNVIDWSWWWVTAPLWLGFVIAIILSIITYVIIKSIKR